MHKHGMIAYRIQEGRMEILSVRPTGERPTSKQLKTFEHEFRGKEVKVTRAPDELLQHKAWSEMESRLKQAIGRVEVALHRNNWEEAHDALFHAERGWVASDPIDTTCAELGMTNRCLDALERNGVIYVWQLLGKNRRELLSITAIGPPSVDDIIERVHKFQQKLRDTGEWEDFCLQVVERLH